MFGLTTEQVEEHPHVLHRFGRRDLRRAASVGARRTASRYVTVADRTAEAFAPVVARLAGT